MTLARGGLEVADVVRTHRKDFEESRHGRVTSTERRVLNDIVACRTATLGGHVERCDRCDHLNISYNSCRNRHCPKCQASVPKDWVEQRQADLLPVEYFHLVFTMPRELATLALQNKKVIYDILFRAAAETLRQVAADPKHLGAEIGFLMVLHTWGQNLEHHPHVHCVVPGGGISADRLTWVPSRRGFFLPVKVLSRLFRGKFLHNLMDAFKKGKLEFHGQLASMKKPSEFRAHLAPLYKKDWFVYSKPPFGGPPQVLKYLARYTHRVAISNSRLLRFEGHNVTFRYKDYRRSGSDRQQVMTLPADEFIRRFLLHVLPIGFHRIRHYGLLAGSARKDSIALARRLLQVTPPPDDDETGELPEYHPPCPHCGGNMIVIETFTRRQQPRAPPSSPSPIREPSP